MKLSKSKKGVQMSQLVTAMGTPDVSQIRRETFNGTEHLVVPTVMLVEGVHHASNAAAPELALAEEFGRFPDSWNGRPVMMSHPQIEGEPVSASHPSILESDSFGILFNTSLDEGKLKSEAWINLSKVEAAPDDNQIHEVVTALEAGETLVEVSTGLFSLVEQSSGKFGNEAFSGVWRDIVPDHLALLPLNAQGACSVADGCGAPRINQVGDEPVGATSLEDNAQSNSSDSSSQGFLTAGVATPPTPTESQDKTHMGIFQKLMKSFGNLLRFTTNAVLSDRDLRTALTAALDKIEPDAYHYVVAVFDAMFVYEGWTGLFKRAYSIADDGTISLGTEVTEVRPVTEFVDVNVQEGIVMNIDTRVSNLITNEATRFKECDRKWLMTLDEKQLESMEPVASTEPPEGSGDLTAAQQAGNNAAAEGTGLKASTTAAAAAPVPPATVEDYLKQAPKDMQEVLSSGLRMHAQRKGTLVKGLLDNSRNKFSEEQLKEMPIEQLENLAALADIPDYSLAGGTDTQDTLRDNADSNFADAPPELYPVEQAG